MQKKTSEPAYEKNKVGPYIFSGEFVLKDGITNSQNHKLNYWVNVVDFDDEGSGDENEGVEKDEDGEIIEEAKEKEVKVEAENIKVREREDSKDIAVVTKFNDDSNKQRHLFTQSCWWD
ncbi:hypothetical protein [Sporosarcina sp. 6E9]|uniref:hypothetical protein n=1 Tax=Sporosarcina sp. 6E9 TaxID=2819235 RepID=UPI001B304F99|nr:hypothetical protein [Sporosarcina sp. 6E9]